MKTFIFANRLRKLAGILLRCFSSLMFGTIAAKCNLRVFLQQSIIIKPQFCSGLNGGV